MALSPPEPAPSEAVLARRRKITYAVTGLLVLAVTGWHTWDAYRRGQSIWPGLSVLPVVALVLFLTARFLGKPIEGKDPAEARRLRAQQLLNRTAPLALVCLLLVVVMRGCAGR